MSASAIYFTHKQYLWIVVRIQCNLKYTITPVQCMRCNVCISQGYILQDLLKSRISNNSSWYLRTRFNINATTEKPPLGHSCRPLHHTHVSTDAHIHTGQTLDRGTIHRYSCCSQKTVNIDHMKSTCIQHISPIIIIVSQHNMYVCSSNSHLLCGRLEAGTAELTLDTCNHHTVNAAHFQW